MSYSFFYQATSKAQAKELIASKFDEIVVASQPIHARDKDAAIANASAAVDLLSDTIPVGNVVYVTMNGSVGWVSPVKEGEQAELTSVSISVHAMYAEPR